MGEESLLVENISNNDSAKEKPSKSQPGHVLEIFGTDLFVEYEVERSDLDLPGFDHPKIFERLRTTFRELLSLDKVSFLFGAGSSVCLGAPTIRNISNFLDNLKDADSNKPQWAIKAEELIQEYGFNALSVEKFLEFLLDVERVTSKGLKVDSKFADVKDMIDGIKMALYQLCNVPHELATNVIPEDDLEPQEEFDQNSNSDLLWAHKQFIRRILSRPINLQRPNLFTLNYDLAFEKAMDELGVTYIDGFVGGTKRYFRPHCYNHDFYYPQSKTEGQVHRLEEVIHLYKLHGSLNWKETERGPFNVYGIEQIRDSGIASGDEVLIYPTPMKEGEMLGFPYSEMIRRFAGAIQQPQSVLVTYGYSFADDHINRIIHDALTIPSFHLVIISYGMDGNIPRYYASLGNGIDERISFIIGNYFADWSTFAMRILPDVRINEIEQRISSTMKKAYDLEKSRKDALDTASESPPF